MKFSAAILAFILLTITVSTFATGVSTHLKSDNIRKITKARGENRETQIDEKSETSAFNLQSLQHEIKPELLSLALDNAATLTEREAADATGNICCPVAGWNWGPADTTRIYQGIDYLRNLNPGICNVGPRSCVRVSCSYDSAIYLCNDNYDTIYPSCKSIAQLAEDLIDLCGQRPSPFSTYSTTCGQRFDSGNFNVIVRQDKC